MVQVTVEKVVIDKTGEQAVVLLADLTKTTYIPIWVRALEASVIALQLEQVDIPRPLTVDLLATVIEKLDARVVMTLITEIKDDVFYASLIIDSEDEDFDVDCRPSDAIAVALKVGAPIYVNEYVLAEAGISVEEGNVQ
jgi:bifunctional DNase/RNase